jgi:hypothetical protein
MPKIRTQYQTTTTSSEKPSSFSIEPEKSFVKFYQDALIKHSDLPMWVNRVFKKLLSLMGYDNRVHIPSVVKEQICIDLGITTDTIYKSIRLLISKNILQRLGSTVLLFNPEFFGRGKWEDIKKIEFNVVFDEATPEGKATAIITKKTER